MNMKFIVLIVTYPTTSGVKNDNIHHLHNCHSEDDLMCMQAFRIILYWILNYYPFASFDYALENHLLIINS